MMEDVWLLFKCKDRMLLRRRDSESALAQGSRLHPSNRTLQNPAERLQVVADALHKLRQTADSRSYLTKL